MTIQQTITNKLREAGVTESIFVTLEYYNARETWSIAVVTPRAVIAKSASECVLDALESVIAAYNEYQEECK
jgi:hypothetical protein